MTLESKYIKFLPSVFHEDVTEEYLKIFETILTGIKDGELERKKSIGETLDITADLFHPRFSFLFDKTKKTFLPRLEYDEKKIFKSYFRADMNVYEFVDEFVDGFLGWLAGWVALVLKEDWELEKKREVIARIIPIYRMRGTKNGILEFLKIYVGGEVEIYEKIGFQISESKIGVDTYIGIGTKPHFFVVKAKITKTNREEQKRFIKNLKNVLDMEKPVHTSYLLKASVPTIRIGYKDGSKVGENTLIGGTFTEIHA